MQYGTLAPVQFEEPRRSFEIKSFVRVVKRRAIYFFVPFVIVMTLGVAITVIQKPIFLSEGKLLVQSQDIPADLVRPTVTEAAGQRIQVIQQKLLARENLLAIVNKFGLFSSQRQWMSGTQLLDLMRDRTQFQSVDVTRPDYQQKNATLAMTLSFSYEDPQVAARVANEFLTLVLDEDAKTRTSRAAETTKFLDREAKRLEVSLGNLEAQIADLRKQAVKSPLTAEQAAAQQTASQLAAAKAELAQKSALYSDAHPDVKALKRKVAALEQVASKAAAPTAESSASNAIEELQKQQLVLEKNLEDANQKLSTARLGEALERNQQAERLQVIEQPTVPQKPIRPNKTKLLMVSLGLALAMGFGAAFAVETLDRSVYSVDQLAGTFDRHSISLIPYIETATESAKSKRKFVFLFIILIAVLGGVAGASWYFFPSLEASIDQSWIDLVRSWVDRLTRLSK